MADVATTLRQRLVSLPVLIPVTAGLPICALFAGQTHGWARAAWVGALLACATTVAVTTWLRERSAARDREDAATAVLASREMAARLLATVAGAGQPLISMLGQLCSEQAHVDQARDDVVALTERVLSTAVQRFGGDPESNRVAFYELPDCETLVLQSWTGRGPAPRRRIACSESAHARSIVSFALGDSAQHYEDLLVQAPAEMEIGEVRSRSYRSFLAAPVKAGSTSLGMLAVDSPRPGNFSETDLTMLVVLAGLLGAGRAVWWNVLGRDRAKPA